MRLIVMIEKESCHAWNDAPSCAMDVGLYTQHARVFYDPIKVDCFFAAQEVATIARQRTMTRLEALATELCCTIALRPL
jgi:hypothetical protein